MQLEGSQRQVQELSAPAGRRSAGGGGAQLLSSAARGIVHGSGLVSLAEGLKLENGGLRAELRRADRRVRVSQDGKIARQVRAGALNDAE